MSNKINICEIFKEDLSNEHLPEIYIDEQLLTCDVQLTAGDKFYKINGDTFRECDEDFDCLQEFYIECRSDDDDSEDFSIDIEVNPHGVVVNSIILLSLHQWNTIITDGDVKCLVCDMTVQDTDIHLQSDLHIANLDNHKPLKKFDLHITREIGDRYHCAVCNEIYDSGDENVHLDGERHLEKMLYATNRGLDVIYDLDIRNDAGSDVSCDTNDVSYDTNDVSCDVGCDNGRVTVSESGFDSECDVDNKDFVANKPGLPSYASVVKKTTKENAYVERVVGNRKIEVPYNAYHMIVGPNRKEVYCMLCVRFVDAKSKTEHCQSPGHLSKLAKCSVLECQDHFVRRVTAKFYHCGSCNNLQLTGCIESHLDTHRSKLNRSKINHSASADSHTKIPKDAMNPGTNMDSSMHRQSKEMNGDVIINHFDCKVRVSLMSYNFILRRDLDYLCVLCNHLAKDISIHLNDLKHIVYLQNAPFQMYFGINLIRMVSYTHVGAHCAICNVFMDSAFIYAHVRSQTHMFILNLAINQASSYRGLNQISTSLIRPANSILLPVINPAPPRNAYQMPQNLPGAIIRHVHNMNQAINLPAYANPSPLVRIVHRPDIAPAAVTRPYNNMNIVMNQGARILPTNSATHQTKANTRPQTETNDLTSANETSCIPLAINHMNIDSNRSTKDAAINPILDLKKCNMDVDEDNMSVLNESVHLKMKKYITKVSLISYHSLVNIGDGKWYCFLCSCKVSDSLRSHIESKDHVDRIKRCKFVEDYERDLLRQVIMTFHCCLCNVLIPKSKIRDHLKWPQHMGRRWDERKYRKRDARSLGCIVEVQLTSIETRYVSEPKVELLLSIRAGDERSDSISGVVFGVKHGDRLKLMNITWDSFHGIIEIKNRSYCNLCRDFLVCVDAHVDEDDHRRGLKRPIEKQYLPACIRKVTDSTLNCLTCNLNFPNAKRNISEHLKGRRHHEGFSKLLNTAFYYE